MLQINSLTFTHRKDLRVILKDFNLVLNPGDKAVIIGEEGNGKSTLLKWIYDESLIEDYILSEGRKSVGTERLVYLAQELPAGERSTAASRPPHRKRIFYETSYFLYLNGCMIGTIM